MRSYLRLAVFAGLAVYVFINAYLYGSIAASMSIARRFNNIRNAHVYGKRDETVQVFTFNHPSILDKFVLFEVLGDFGAIARDMSNVFSPFNFVMKRTGCVLVRKSKSGQNTTQKVIDHLETFSRPFLIATSSGIVSDRNIPDPLPTIAFRLQRRVQPIVIAYESCQALPDTLPKCIPFVMNPPRFVQPHVFFLPSVDPTLFSSADECAKHVREQMMRVINFCQSKLGCSHEK